LPTTPGRGDSLAGLHPKNVGDFGGGQPGLWGDFGGGWRDSLAGLAGLHPNVGNCGGNCGGMAKTSSDLKGIFFVIL